MKKKIYLIAICITIIAILLIRGVYHNLKNRNQPQNAVVMEEEGKVTRAVVAKMVCFLFYTNDEILSLDREIIYEDTDESKWYDQYINCFSSLGLIGVMNGSSENKIQPNKFITYEECNKLLKTLYQNEEKEWTRKLSFSLEEGSNTKEILNVQWEEIYKILIEDVAKKGIQEEKIFVIGTPNKLEQLSQDQIMTDKGMYHCHGWNLDQYIDKKILVYVRENEIISISKAFTGGIMLENIYIIEGNKKEMSVFLNGFRRSFTLKNPLSESMLGVIGDLLIEDGEIIKVSIKPDVINDKVLVANDKYIELENYGKLYLSENYKIYRIYDELMMELTSGILVGYNTTNFVVADGKICAALITDTIKAENIRVLIKTEGFKDIFHEKVVLSSDTSFTIYYGKKKKKLNAGEKVTIDKNSDYLSEGRIRITAEKEEGKLSLLHLKRSEKNPYYRGNIEIASNEKGLTIINELPLEEYLYGVIPSEMPTSYGLEALKVQAICARSYAFRQLLSNSQSEYGAHVDDSVSYQVYNNIPEDKDSISAVKDTYGKVMEYKGEVINSYYFSTSCGHTSSADQVWFSSETLPYLKGRMQSAKETKTIDLSKEKNFVTFITDNSYKTYDSQFPWYRWNVEIDKEDLKKSIDANIKKRYEANTQLIQTLDSKNRYKSIPIETVGTIENIEINKRQTGGIVTEVIIEGSEHTVKVTTEYNIRVLLAPLYDKVIRQDKSEVKSLSMLPSAFFVIKPAKKDGDIVGYKIIGGGYGHGVGMSQNGVKAMTENDKKYEEILLHYYQGVNIGFIY